MNMFFGNIFISVDDNTAECRTHLILYHLSPVVLQGLQICVISLNLIEV